MPLRPGSCSSAAWSAGRWRCDHDTIVVVADPVVADTVAQPATWTVVHRRARTHLTDHPAAGDHHRAAVLHRVRPAVRASRTGPGRLAAPALLRLADSSSLAVSAHPGRARRPGPGAHPGRD